MLKSFLRGVLVFEFVNYVVSVRGISWHMVKENIKNSNTHKKAIIIKDNFVIYKKFKNKSTQKDKNGPNRITERSF